MNRSWNSSSRRQMPFRLHLIFYSIWQCQTRSPNSSIFLRRNEKIEFERADRPYLCLFNYRSDENRPLAAFFVKLLHATIQNRIRYSDLRLIFKLNFLECQTRSENIMFYGFNVITITSCHLFIPI